MHNAEHLMLQWNSEIEAIKLCDEKIKFFKEAFSPKLWFVDDLTFINLTLVFH